MCLFRKTDNNNDPTGQGDLRLKRGAVSNLSPEVPRRWPANPVSNLTSRPRDLESTSLSIGDRAGKTDT